MISGEVVTNSTMVSPPQKKGSASPYHFCICGKRLNHRFRKTCGRPCRLILEAVKRKKRGIACQLAKRDDEYKRLFNICEVRVDEEKLLQEKRENY